MNIHKSYKNVSNLIRLILNYSVTLTAGTISNIVTGTTKGSIRDQYLRHSLFQTKDVGL